MHTIVHPELIFGLDGNRAGRLPTPRGLLSELDELVTSGVYESRAVAVRAGVEAITALEYRRRTDQAIIEGYRRTPPVTAESDAAVASLRGAIAEEPW